MCGRVAIPHQHLRNSARFFHHLIETGRLHSDGELLAAVKQLSADLDRKFELEVARRCRQHGFLTATRRKRLGGKKIEDIPGPPLGALDVLAWSAARKLVFVLDAKRMAPGIPPLAIRRQGQELDQAATRHARPLGWVRDHLESLGREIAMSANPTGSSRRP